MLTTALFLVAIVVIPVALVLAVLFVLGSAVVGLIDGATNGLVRPNPS